MPRSSADGHNMVANLCHPRCCYIYSWSSHLWWCKKSCPIPKCVGGLSPTSLVPSLLTHPNQRGFRSNAYIRNFAAAGEILHDPELVRPEAIIALLTYAGREVGIGASRKMGWGRFAVTAAVPSSPSRRRRGGCLFSPQASPLLLSLVGPAPTRGTFADTCSDFIPAVSRG